MFLSVHSFNPSLCCLSPFSTILMPALLRPCCLLEFYLNRTDRFHGFTLSLFVDNMDDLLEYCFFCALLRMKKVELPLLTSTFFRTYLLPSW